MVRPPDDLRPARTSVVLGGRETLLGGDADTPLMSDAIAWGGLLFLSGRAAVDPATGAVRGAGFAEQLDVILSDAALVLAEAGSGFEHVLRVECWLTDRANFADWNAVYARTFPHPRPARTTLIVSELPLAGLLVELQITATAPA
jgi:2-iminobutanoate/2-iminopropanoate deaminase